MSRPLGVKNKADAFDDELAMESNVVVATVVEAPPANTFNDEYTLQVDMDYDPASDIFRIPKPSPEYEYRFLRDDQKNMSIKTSNLLKNKGGWQVVPKTHLLKCGYDAARLSADGCYRVGELILSFMPKKYYQIKRDADTKTNNTKMEQIANRAAEGDSVKGIKSGKMDGGRVVFERKSKRDVLFTTREE